MEVKQKWGLKTSGILTEGIVVTVIWRVLGAAASWLHILETKA